MTSLLLLTTVLTVIAFGGKSVTASNGTTEFDTRVQLMEAWQQNEIPQSISNSIKAPFEYKISSLALQGNKQPAPWPGSYWPQVYDSINFQWDPVRSGVSATVKYARAFGIDEKLLENAVSKTRGIDEITVRKYCKRCTKDDECAAGTEVCGKRNGRSLGRCVPKFWGLCHGWAPASILEEEPQCSVKVNNVTFHVADIKALLSMLYDSNSGGVVDGLVKLSDLCYDTRNMTSEMPRDMFGRIDVPGCRNLNAGSFHVVLTNLMRLGTSFIVDIDPSYAVWNHPVRGYRVLEMRNITFNQAGRFFRGQPYQFNPQAVSLRYVKTQVQYVNVGYEYFKPIAGDVDLPGKTYLVPKEYTYILELDAADKVIGGEWIGKSKFDHPDVAWIYTKSLNRNTIHPRIQVGTLADGTPNYDGIRYALVRKILLKSVYGCSNSTISTNRVGMGVAPSERTVV